LCRSRPNRCLALRLMTRLTGFRENRGRTNSISKESSSASRQFSGASQVTRGQAHRQSFWSDLDISRPPAFPTIVRRPHRLRQILSPGRNAINLPMRAKSWWRSGPMRRPAMYLFSSCAGPSAIRNSLPQERPRYRSPVSALNRVDNLVKRPNMTVLYRPGTGRLSRAHIAPCWAGGSCSTGSLRGRTF